MRRRLGGTRRIGGRRRGCASAAPVPSQVPALEPSWNPSQVRGTDRVRFRVLTKWRRGESNRPAEDSGGRRSKLYRDLSWGCLPPTTLHYRQLVPEGQPRASASKPDDRAHSAHLSPSQPRPERDGRTVATV